MVSRDRSWSYLCPYAGCGKVYSRREYVRRHSISAHGFDPQFEAIERRKLEQEFSPTTENAHTRVPEESDTRGPELRVSGIREPLTAESSLVLIPQDIGASSTIHVSPARVTSTPLTRFNSSCYAEETLPRENAEQIMKIIKEQESKILMLENELHRAILEKNHCQRILQAARSIILD